MGKGVWLALSALVAILAVVATGCGGSGGSDETEDPTAAWASGFCGAIKSWTDGLENVTSQFSDTSNLSEDGLQSAANDVRDSTQQLVDDLKSLGRPETDSGQEVQDAVDGLSTTLDNETAKIEDTANGVSGITGLPSAIATISTSLSAMATAFSDTLQTIQNADVDGELQSALEDSPDCAGITS
jgi:hypothetical protein